MPGINRISSLYNSEIAANILRERLTLASPHAAAPAAQPAKNAKVADAEDIKKMVSQLNSVLDSTNVKLSMGMEGDIPFVKVIDSRSGNVIRQLPPQEMIDVWLKIREAVKNIIDKNA